MRSAVDVGLFGRNCVLANRMHAAPRSSITLEIQALRNRLGGLTKCRTTVRRQLARMSTLPVPMAGCQWFRSVTHAFQV